MHGVFRPVLRIVLGSLCLLAVWGVLYQPEAVSIHLTDTQMMAVLTTHCPALRQQPDVLGCLPDPTGIRLITDRPALMPTQVAGIPVVTDPPPPHLPPPPGGDCSAPYRTGPAANAQPLSAGLHRATEIPLAIL